MQLKEFNILLDIKKHNKTDYFEVVQGDLNSNVLNITLVDGLNPYNLTGTNVEIVFSKPDRTTVIQDNSNGVVIINELEGKIQCTLNTNTIASPGKVIAEVRVLGEEILLTSTRFDFFVRRPIFGDDTIKSTNEFPILNQLITTTEGLIQQVEQIEKQVPENVLDELNNLSALAGQLQSELSDLEADVNSHKAESVQQILNLKNDIENKLNTKADKTEIEGLNDRIDQIITTPAEGISEQEIIDARQGKASIGANLTSIKNELSTQAGFPVTNILENGDFSQGTTGWEPYRVGASISANNNVLSIVGDGSIIQPRVFKNTTKQIIENHKYYLKVKAKVSHEECNSIRLLALGATTGISRTVMIIDNPIPNDEYELSAIYEPWATDKGTLRVGFGHQYENTATALGKIAEISYFLVIDLTEIFGEGNEPTKEEIDLLIDKFPNRWFQTANLLTFKDSYLELSSKIKVINNSLQVLTPSVGFIDNPLQSEFHGQAMVTLSYDDGFLNNYNLALPLHEKYGIPATFNIITSNITSSKFMNAEKILNCHHRGIEIASHSHNHIDLLNCTDEEIIFECTESKRILESIIGVGEVETMAIPFSKYDDRVRGIVSQYFKGIRVYSENLNNIPPTDRYHLYARIAVGNTTTFAQVKSAIDSAISQKKWCIIMLHGINNGTRDQYEISQRLLDEILKYIAIQSRDVLLPINTRDALKYSLGASY